jgi:hypothetical protein
MVALASVDHIRRPTLNPRYRAELYQRLTDLAQLLHEHDRAAVAWAEQRRRIFDEMQRTHDLLWDIDCFNGRQPPRPGEPPLPPTSEDPIHLYGRRLRTTCLAILARHGCQSLPELHTLVHLYGYAVANKYFPGDTTLYAPQRLFRLTRAQLDVTTEMASAPTPTGLMSYRCARLNSIPGGERPSGLLITRSATSAPTQAMATLE